MSTISNAIVEFNEIRDNYAGEYGGGIYDYGGQPYSVIRNNVISGNGTHVNGGGAWFGGATFIGNLVVGNWSDYFAGGLYGGGEIRNNTIVLNGGEYAVWAVGMIVANIIVRNQGQGIIACAGSPNLECNNSWGNDGGDWTTEAPCDTTMGSNFSADPLFCAEYPEDYRISQQSPCAPGGHPGCGLVGAFPVGCGATAVQPTTWGRIKASFR